MGGKCRFEVDQASLFQTAKVGASKCLGEQIELQQFAVPFADGETASVDGDAVAKRCARRELGCPYSETGPAGQCNELGYGAAFLNKAGEHDGSLSGGIA
jgi:hypothetical protein